MTYLDFQSSILADITKRYADSAEVSLSPVKKNNDVELCGLMIHEFDTELTPTIYLESYYELLCSGSPYDAVMERIIAVYEKNKLSGDHIADYFCDYQKVREHIVMRLLNRNKSKCFLRDVPYIPFLDLALCFAVRMEIKKDSVGSALIHKSHLDMWGIDIEKIFEQAKKNAKTILPPEFGNVGELMRSLVPPESLPTDSPEELPMYILTNREHSYGAATVCYHGVIREISDQIGDDLCIIPSSVHEVLVFPMSLSAVADGINDLIKSVNRTILSESEILSDHAYYYHRATDRITL